MTAILRVTTCGSIDAGKSTLIGRPPAETGSVAEDLLDIAYRHLDLPSGRRPTTSTSVVGAC
jgi:sulfate adenylyltransferase subunit 1 (EFTu-like GTPase family)